MIVFDAGVLIAHLNETDAFHRAARDFFDEFEEFDFGANVVTIAECLVRPAQLGHASQTEAKLDRLHLIRLDLPAEAAARVADIRAHAKLKMPDAIVLYTAEREGVELVTTDAALARAAGERGVTAHLLVA